MFTEVKSIKWKKEAFEEANETYNFEDAHDGMDPHESFPEDEPAYRVFKGDVVVDGTAAFGAEDDDDCTLFVIDGNLTVRGPFVVFQGDLEGYLYVTGDVTCDDCLVLTDAHLSIGGSLTVKNLLVTDLSDMATMFVKKSLTATTWVNASPHTTIKLGARPNAGMFCMPGARGLNIDESGPLAHRFDTAAAGDASKALLPAFVEDGRVDGLAIREAVLAGKPVLQGQ